MLNREQYYWIVLRLPQLLFDVTHCIAEVGDTIRQPILELIGRHHNHTSIDVTILEIVAYMNDITSKKIASAGNLNLVLLFLK